MRTASNGTVLLAWLSLLIPSIVLLLICPATTSDDAAHKEALAQIVGVYYSTTPQLNSLPAVVDPGEVDVECCLDNTENDADWVEEVLGCASDDPVKYVECAVSPERDKIVAVENGRYRGLAEE